MIFRRRKGQEQGGVATAVPDSADLFEKIEELERANRESNDPETERRLIRLRHQAGARLLAEAVPGEYASADFESLPEGSGIPEVDRGQLTPELLRAAMLRNGCLLVRGFVPAAEAIHLVAEIDRAHEFRAAQDANGSASQSYYHEFVPDPEFGHLIGREWVSDTDLWAADSPRVMFEMTEMFERAELRDLVSGYLGERPTLSVEKCTFRKVSPEAGNVWHQDGAFLGDVRALNVWLSLSRCGDQAPGLDVIPRRFEGFVHEGTQEFDWAVTNERAEEVAGGVEVVRPIFEPGDMLLFDELCLHRTAANPEMPNYRYAIESWFFGPSGFPAEYSPLRF